MLCNAHSCTGDDKSCGRGNVECSRAIAAGTARIHECLARVPATRGEDRCGVAAHRGCKPDQFVQSLAFGSQSGKQGCDLGVGRAPGQDALHRGVCFAARQVYARGDFFQRLLDHGFVGGNARLARFAGSK